MKLSISKAWDETKSRIAADGRLIFTVALALIAFPTAVSQFIVPQTGPAGQPQTLGEAAMMLVVTIIGLVGQLAMIRLAVGPSISVGSAIAHGARRTPVYIGTVLLLLLGLFLLALPVGLLMGAMGASFEPGTPPPPGAALVLLLFVGILLYFALRMILTSVIASIEPVGPLTVIKRSWRLTSGHALRLFGFIILFIIAALILMMAVSVAFGSLVTLLLGPIEPLSLSALLVALAAALASAALTTLFVVIVARIYVQLSAGGAVETSVPSSGT